jgi:hypothetical protein
MAQILRLEQPENPGSPRRRERAKNSWATSSWKAERSDPLLLGVITSRPRLKERPAVPMQTGLPLPGRGLPAGRPAGQSAEPTPWGQGSRVVALSHEINVCKPDPAAYACVLGRLGMPAGAAAYVGDGSSDELTGARAAGFALVVLAEEAPARLGPMICPGSGPGRYGGGLTHRPCRTHQRLNKLLPDRPGLHRRERGCGTATWQSCEHCAAALQQRSPSRAWPAALQGSRSPALASARRLTSCRSISGPGYPGRPRRKSSARV